MRGTELLLSLIVLGGVITFSTTLFQTLIGNNFYTVVGNVAQNVTVVFVPTNVLPFLLFLAFLVATVDIEYFPTGGILATYVTLMVIHGVLPWPTSIEGILGTIACVGIYLVVGAIWVGVKWWSYLRDPKNTSVVQAVKDGHETEFFISRVRYLYPHFLYWPLSLPHTVLTKLCYQIFEFAARYWSGTFARMVANRKAELQSQVVH